MSKKTQFDDLLKKQDTPARGSDQKHQILDNIVKSNDEIPVITTSSSKNKSNFVSSSEVGSKTNLESSSENDTSGTVNYDSNNEGSPIELKEISPEKKEDPQLNPSANQIGTVVNDSETTVPPTSNAYSYLENYLRESARGLITIKNGRVVKTKKTDTYEHTTVYLDKNLASRLTKFLKQGGLDKSPFINVAVSYFLDQLEKTHGN